MTKRQKVLLVGLGIPCVYWLLWLLLLWSMPNAFTFLVLGCSGLFITVYSVVWIFSRGDFNSLFNSYITKLNDWINKE